MDEKLCYLGGGIVSKQDKPLQTKQTDLFHFMAFLAVGVVADLLLGEEGALDAVASNSQSRDLKNKVR